MEKISEREANRNFGSIDEKKSIEENMSNFCIDDSQVYEGILAVWYFSKFIIFKNSSLLIVPSL